jgi:hypothetical protein
LRTILGLCVSGFVAILPVHAGDEFSRRFVWDEARTRTETAQTPADFSRVADSYRRLLQAGSINGTVLYNLGTALLLAGQYEAAKVCLLRAERHLGTTPDIERNLRLAAAKGGPVEDAALAWYRAPLFWHFGMAASARIGVAALAFAAFWLAMTVRVCFRRAPIAPFVCLAVIVFVLFATSSGVSLYQESREPLPLIALPAEAGRP